MRWVALAPVLAAGTVATAIVWLVAGLSTTVFDAPAATTKVWTWATLATSIVIALACTACLVLAVRWTAEGALAAGAGAAAAPVALVALGLLLLRSPSRQRGD